MRGGELVRKDHRGRLKTPPLALFPIFHNLVQQGAGSFNSPPTQQIPRGFDRKMVFQIREGTCSIKIAESNAGPQFDPM